MNLGPKEYALGAALLGGAIGVVVIASRTVSAATKNPAPTPAPAPVNVTQGGGAPAPTPTPMPPQTPAPSVTVTAANDGQTIQLRKNQTLIIDLTASSDTYTISDSTGIMQLQSSGTNTETWFAGATGTDTITCVPGSQQGSFVNDVNVTFNIVVS